MYKISEYLTNEERMDAIRFGFTQKLAQYNVKPSDLEKSAQSGSPSISGSINNIASLALLLGLPIGSIAHLIGKSLRKDDVSILQLKQNRDYYKAVASEIESNLLNKDEEEEANAVRKYI